MLQYLLFGFIFSVYFGNFVSSPLSMVAHIRGAMDGPSAVRVDHNLQEKIAGWSAHSLSFIFSFLIDPEKKNSTKEHKIYCQFVRNKKV